MFVCKKIQSDSNLDQLPESTANLISYGIINKRSSYLCEYVELHAVGPGFAPATQHEFGACICVPHGSHC